MRARRSAMATSRFVQVGDLNMTVSERMAPAMSPAILGAGMMPRSWYIAVRMVFVLPTGSLRTRIGAVVCISARRWWSIISSISTWSRAGTLWAASFWSTSTTCFLRGRSRWKRLIVPTTFPAEFSTG